MAESRDPRIIRVDNIKKYAGSLLDFLENVNIKDIDSLRREIGVHSFPPLGFQIEIDERESTGGTLALTLTYGVYNVGVPIEGRINEKLDYLKIFVKSIDEIPGYVPMGTDSNGNHVQERTIVPRNNVDRFARIAKEFRRLRDL